MMQAAGMPTLRKSRSVGQPILWWCPRKANLGQPPQEIRLVLTELAERISQALKEEAELKQAVSRLMNRNKPKKDKT